MPKKTNDKNEIIDKIENVVNTIKSKVVKKEPEKKAAKKSTTSKTTSKAKNSAVTKTKTSKKTAVTEETTKKTNSKVKLGGTKAPSTKNKTSSQTSSKAKSTKSTNKSTTKHSQKASPTKETPSKKTAKSKTSTNRLSAVTKSINEEKKATTKNVASKKTSSTKTTKPSTTKKATSSAKKTKTTTKKSTKTTTPIIEYYDLPYRYNQTVVKILAQTPRMLFVYWDISDKDREKYKQYYGEDFFSSSRPVLIIHNETMNYSFELEINDFANSWYIQVNDANCKYNVELGRKPNHYITTLKENYVYISSSNKLDAPNDHILFEHATPNIKYKNVKNNQINIKDFSNSAFIKKILQTYSINTIEELYEKLYEKDLLEEFKNGYFTNPGSSPSSNFK